MVDPLNLVQKLVSLVGSGKLLISYRYYCYKVILIVFIDTRSPKPFDRHDWTVDRCGRQIRYVLDYYVAPPDEEGNPVFNVDVRPALDSFESVWDRIRMNVREFRDLWQSTNTSSTSSSSATTHVERSEAV